MPARRYIHEVIEVYVVATHGRAYQMSTLFFRCDTLQAPPSMIFFFCFLFCSRCGAAPSSMQEAFVSQLASAAS